MDRYLFDKFVFEMDDELYGDSCIAFATKADYIVKKPDEEKAAFNYFPHQPNDLQIVVGGTVDKGLTHIHNVKMHHVSEDVWQLKIVSAIDENEGSYLATRMDGNGLVAIRLANEHVLDNIESGSIIDAQVVAFAVDVKIYNDEKEYEKSGKSFFGRRKLLMKDGLIAATNYVVNNSAKSTQGKQKNKEHRFDNLVDVCGTITLCDVYSLNMLGMDLNNYYMAEVVTDFGRLKIIIARSLLPKNIKGFGDGNIIVGKVLLSGDVCIYDYDKYIIHRSN